MVGKGKQGPVKTMDGKIDISPDGGTGCLLAGRLPYSPFEGIFFVALMTKNDFLPVGKMLDDQAPDHPHFRIVDHGLDAFAETAGEILVIGVEEGYEFASRLFHAQIAGRVGTLVFLAEVADLVAPGLDLFGSLVGRTVIDHDNFLGFVILLHGGTDGAIDEFRAVISGNNDRYHVLNRAHCVSAFCLMGGAASRFPVGKSVRFLGLFVKQTLGAGRGVGSL